MIPEPPWLTDLPRLAPMDTDGSRCYYRPAPYQRLPVPALSTPGSTTHDRARALALAFRRRCMFCGCACKQFWRVSFHSADRPTTHPGGVVTARPPGPIMHKSCAVYASIVCPFLRTSRATRRSDGMRRGDAEIVRYAQYGVAFFDEHSDWPVTWGYLDPVESITFKSWRDLLPVYDDIVETVDTNTRLYWTDDKQLDGIARQDEIRLAALRATALTHVRGYVYRLALL